MDDTTCLLIDAVLAAAQGDREALWIARGLVTSGAWPAADTTDVSPGEPTA